MSSNGKLFSLPGGQARRGESDYKCVTRELREETGLIATSCSFLFEHTSKHYYHKVHLVTTSGEAIPHQEIRYIAYYTGANVPLLHSSRRIIERYKNTLYKNEIENRFSQEDYDRTLREERTIGTDRVPRVIASRFNQKNYNDTLRREKSQPHIKRTIKISLILIIIITLGVTVFSVIRLSSNQVIQAEKIQVNTNKAMSGDSISASVTFSKYIDDGGDPIMSFFNNITPLHSFIMNYVPTTKTFDIRMDETLLIKKDITLNSNKTFNYSFPIIAENPGNHVISINNLSCEFLVLNQSRFNGDNFSIQPFQPSIGEDIMVTVDVTNVGTIVDTKNLQLFVNNKQVDVSQIILSPGQEKTIKFLISVDKTGNCNITLKGLSDDFNKIVQVTNFVNAATGKYKNYYLGLVKAPDGVNSNSYGEFVVLINNKNAGNPTYTQLGDFLNQDKTDQYPYQYSISSMGSYYGTAESHVDLTTVKGIIDGTIRPNPPRICSDFAEMLHNNAEKAGLRCAYVSIDLSGYTDPYSYGISSNTGHALVAFNTTDRGLIYIDDTGLSGSHPLSCDKIIDVFKVGSSYIPRSFFPERGWSSTWGNMGTVTSIYVTWDGNWNN